MTKLTIAKIVVTIETIEIIKKIKQEYWKYPASLVLAGVGFVKLFLI